MTPHAFSTTIMLSPENNETASMDKLINVAACHASPLYFQAGDWLKGWFHGERYYLAFDKKLLKCPSILRHPRLSGIEADGIRVEYFTASLKASLQQSKASRSSWLRNKRKAYALHCSALWDDIIGYDFGYKLCAKVCRRMLRFDDDYEHVKEISSWLFAWYYIPFTFRFAEVLHSSTATQ